MAELLAGEADGGGINDGSEAFEVLDQQPVKERLVAVEESDQADILLEGIVLRKDVLEFHRDLLLDCQDGGRKETFNAEAAAFATSKGGVLILRGVAEHFLTVRPTDVKAVFGFHRKLRKVCAWVQMDAKRY